MCGKNFIYLIKNTIINSINAVPLEEKINSIEFKNVSFGYNENEKTLKNISFKSKIGECTAIVGGSGSGKTTLVNMIPRFYDLCSGDILINDKSIKEFQIHSLRNNIGIGSPQNTVLFNQSIRYNISHGKENATDDQIIEVSKKLMLMNL